ncbi:unnamed protein product [Paramecium primaurelia]|uniref:Uncharacterized protein n=1 Tax=Paramecium primaurelia TaxID=5886 RepID=A0A8S1PC87_PARPR|nr:unnamed protein product [Paramecium primaurelia]
MLGKKFDLIYEKGAFLWAYVSEGLEEFEFSVAREALASIEFDVAPDSTNHNN